MEQGFAIFGHIILLLINIKFPCTSLRFLRIDPFTRFLSASGPHKKAPGAMALMLITGKMTSSIEGRPARISNRRMMLLSASWLEGQFVFAPNSPNPGLSAVASKVKEVAVELLALVSPSSSESYVFASDSKRTW